MPIFNSRTAARISALLASTALFGVPAQAETVGTAAAVNPATEGVQGGGVRTLRLGSKIVRNETVRTSASGSTQILFVDKTTLNIGPSSSVTIDNYVFNPQANTGEATIRLGKGLMRFVGGEISHNNAVTIKTPAATVGVRGGTVTIGYTSEGLRVILHFGTAEVSNGCGTVVLRRGGYAVTVAGPGECPSDPEKATLGPKTSCSSLRRSVKQGSSRRPRATSRSSSRSSRRPWACWCIRGEGRSGSPWRPAPPTLPPELEHRPQER